MTEEKTEGICLQETPYLEKGKILKVFTKESGLLSVMEKRKASHLTPFCLGEWVLRKGRSEIYTLIEGSLLDPFLHLRNSYETLVRAGQLTQDLLRSQLPGKSAPSLYLLFLSYLKKLGQFQNPALLSTSFQLKLLLHEGLFLLEPQSFPQFSLQDWEVIFPLCYAPTFTELSRIPLSPSLEEKINAFFQN